MARNDRSCVKDAAGTAADPGQLASRAPVPGGEVAPVSKKQVVAPRLVQTVLPPYEIPELIVMGGLIVENRGQGPANNIKIVLEYDDPVADKIRHFQVVTDAEYILRGGGEQQSFVTLRLRRLDGGQRVVLYYSGPTQVQPRVTVTHYEG
jgi:hypothetical protein